MTTHVEHLKQLLLRYDDTLEPLLFLDRRLRELLQTGVVGICDGPLGGSECMLSKVVQDIPFVNSHFVEEALFRGWTNAQMATIVTLGGFTQDMGRRMPEHTLAYGLVRKL